MKTGEEINPEDFNTVPVGSIIRNHKGEFGMIVDRDEHGVPLESRAVLRLTRKQARRLMKEMDREAKKAKKSA